MMRRPLPVKPGMRQPVPTPVQGGGMSRPAMPGKPDMGGVMQRQAFKKGGMVSARGRGCEVRGTKACKMS